MILQIIPCDLGWMAQYNDGTRILVCMWAVVQGGPPEMERTVHGMACTTTTNDEYPVQLCNEIKEGFSHYVWTGVQPH